MLQNILLNNKFLLIFLAQLFSNIANGNVIETNPLVCSGSFENPWFCSLESNFLNPLCSFMYELKWNYDRNASSLTVEFIDKDTKAKQNQYLAGLLHPQLSNDWYFESNQTLENVFNWMESDNTTQITHLNQSHFKLNQTIKIENLSCARIGLIVFDVDEQMKKSELMFRINSNDICIGICNSTNAFKSEAELFVTSKTKILRSLIKNKSKDKIIMLKKRNIDFDILPSLPEAKAFLQSNLESLKIRTVAGLEWLKNKVNNINLNATSIEKEIKNETVFNEILTNGQNMIEKIKENNLTRELTGLLFNLDKTSSSVFLDDRLIAKDENIVVFLNETKINRKRRSSEGEQLDHKSSPKSKSELKDFLIKSNRPVELIFDLALNRSAEMFKISQNNNIDMDSKNESLALTEQETLNTTNSSFNQTEMVLEDFTTTRPLGSQIDFEIDSTNLTYQPETTTEQIFNETLQNTELTTTLSLSTTTTDDSSTTNTAIVSTDSMTEASTANFVFSTESTTPLDVSNVEIVNLTSITATRVPMTEQPIIELSNTTSEVSSPEQIESQTTPTVVISSTEISTEANIKESSTEESTTEESTTDKSTTEESSTEETSLVESAKESTKTDHQLILTTTAVSEDETDSKSTDDSDDLDDSDKEIITTEIETTSSDITSTTPEYVQLVTESSTTGELIESTTLTTETIGEQTSTTLSSSTEDNLTKIGNFENLLDNVKFEVTNYTSSEGSNASSSDAKTYSLRLHIKGYQWNDKYKNVNSTESQEFLRRKILPLLYKYLNVSQDELNEVKLVRLFKGKQ